MVTIDRTVASGPITFKIKGTAVDETTLAPNETTQLFPNDTTAASVNVATVGARYLGNTAVFTIGSTSYTLNGAL